MAARRAPRRRERSTMTDRTEQPQENPQNHDHVDDAGVDKPSH
ncbi:hypothetical protein [Rathayibacter sp. AY1D5]|nr:hypothetical protein [Rathayibacter sp. AY1D5]